MFGGGVDDGAEYAEERGDVGGGDGAGGGDSDGTSSSEVDGS